MALSVYGIWQKDSVAILLPYWPYIITTELEDCREKKEKLSGYIFQP